MIKKKSLERDYQNYIRNYTYDYDHELSIADRLAKVVRANNVDLMHQFFDFDERERFTDWYAKAKMNLSDCHSYKLWWKAYRKEFVDWLRAKRIETLKEYK